MKQLILILSILSLVLCGAWGCSENPEKSAGTAEIKGADDVETAQTGMAKATEDAKEKAKKAIEEMKAATQGSSEETKGSE
jgi:hypothetical protein